MKDKYKKMMPYLIVCSSFFAVLIIASILIDSVILPALIHDKNTVKIPNVSGLQVAEAQKILEANGLTISKLNEQYSDKVQQGVVINQVPKADQIVKSGRSVYLTVSKGQESVPMPYLIGTPVRTARILLKNKGLELGNAVYGPSDIYGIDTVISQKIQSGMQVPYGSSVDLVISRGPESQVKVPILEGLSLDEAKNLLKESGLQLGSVNTIKSGTYLPNTIRSQSPTAGELVNKNTPINLVITN